VDVLLRAVGLLAPQFPRLRLVQIGSEANAHSTELMKRLAREVMADDRVVWAGLRNDVADLVSATDIYCQPSRGEGLGLGVMEAMASGLPVVASRVGGLCESVVDGQTGLLVPPESPEALAAALAGLLRDGTKRRQMGEAGRLHVQQNFVLEENTRRLVDMYERMWRQVRQ
jgi:glycosyltransferase involved in cell wall biosynthesis